MRSVGLGIKTFEDGKGADSNCKEALVAGTAGERAVMTCGTVQQLIILSHAVQINRCVVNV